MVSWYKNEKKTKRGWWKERKKPDKSWHAHFSSSSSCLLLFDAGPWVSLHQESLRPIYSFNIARLGRGVNDTRPEPSVSVFHSARTEQLAVYSTHTRENFISSGEEKKKKKFIYSIRQLKKEILSLNDSLTILFFLSGKLLSVKSRRQDKFGG